MAYNAALGYDPEKDYTVDTLKQQLTALATQLQEKAGATGSYTYKDFTNTQGFDELKNRYEYSGQKAAKDTLGHVAARTGGMASSYAQSAAQQGYNDWMAKLYEAAQDAYTADYNRWNTERGEAQDRITAYLQAGGAPGSLDADLLRRSGYTQGELSALQKYYARLLAKQFADDEPTVVSKSSGGGNSNNGIMNKTSGQSNTTPGAPAYVYMGREKVSYDTLVKELNKGDNSKYGAQMNSNNTITFYNKNNVKDGRPQYR